MTLVAPLDLLDDLVGELGALGLTAQVSRQVLAVLDGGEARLLDDVGVRDELHVAQHHHGRQQQRRGVGQVLAGDVGRRSVDLTQTHAGQLSFSTTIHYYYRYTSGGILTDSKRAPLSPMLPEGVRPSPPTRPAHMSDMMSPYKLGITCTQQQHQFSELNT